MCVPQTLSVLCGTLNTIPCQMRLQPHLVVHRFILEFLIKYFTILNIIPQALNSDLSIMTFPYSNQITTILSFTKHIPAL